MFTHYKDADGKTYSLEDAQLSAETERIRMVQIPLVDTATGDLIYPEVDKLQVAKVLLGKSLEEITLAQMQELTKPVFTPEELKDYFTRLIQARLDAFAQSRGYDNILSAASYGNSTVARFKTDGLQAITIRDKTWDAAYEILTKVESGQRAMPKSIEEIEADLPPTVWS